MSIVTTKDGIGIHEMERDIDIGDDLEIKLDRAVEKAYLDPTEKNVALVTTLAEKLDSYATKIAQKYKM